MRYFLILLLVLLSSNSHAQQVKISALPVPSTGSTSLSSGDLVPATRGSTTYGLTFPTITSTPLTGFVAAPGTITANDTILTAINKLAAVGGGTQFPLRVITTGTTDTVLSTDSVIAWNSTSTGTKTQNFPVCNSFSRARQITIKDEIGSASLYNISVVPASGTVESASSLNLSVARQSISFVCDGISNWMAI